MWNSSIESIHLIDTNNICNTLTHYFINDEDNHKQIEWKILMNDIIQNSLIASKCENCSKNGEKYYRCLTCEIDGECYYCKDCFNLDYHQLHNYFIYYQRELNQHFDCYCGRIDYLNILSFCEKHKMYFFIIIIGILK